MKELNDEMVETIKEYYAKYKSLMRQKKSYTDDSRTIKNNFISKYFEDEDAEDRKIIKKSVSRYLTSIKEVDDGTEPLADIKNFRKEHLDFPEESMYDELLHIYKRIAENNEAKEEINEKIDREIGMVGSASVGESSKVFLSVLKLWFDMEEGKFPITLQVVDAYRAIIGKVGG